MIELLLVVSTINYILKNQLIIFRRINNFFSSPFAMISGVAFGTLRAHISTVNISWFIELTTRAEIIGFDGKWASAFLAIFTGASRCDTVISYSATIAFWTHSMMFAYLHEIMQKI